MAETKRAKRPAAAKKSAASAKKITAPAPTEKVRQRKVSKYKSFRMTKKIPHPAGPLPSAWRLLGKTKRLIWANKKALLIVLAVYAVLNLVLVRNFAAPLNIGEVKDTLKQTFGTTTSATATTSTIFGLLLGSSNKTTTESAGLYQGMLLIYISLVVVWIFRQSAAGQKPKAKQAFYNAAYPVIPMLLVMTVIFLQFIPGLIGGLLYSTVVGGGLAVTAFEKGLWLLLFILLAILSLYMICSSLFALYISTLPDMTPLKALRSARQLVLSRRFNVLRKLLAIPIVVLIVLLFVVVPTIYFAAAVAPWLYFVLMMAGLIFLHAYLFTVYRELL